MNKRFLQLESLLALILLFSLNTFSQTKLNIDINDLRSPNIGCHLKLIIEQEDARFPYYEYLIENDTINDIVYLNGAEMKIKLPFDGKITYENIRIIYTLKRNGIINKDTINGLLVM